MSSPPSGVASRPPRLLDRVCSALRVRHYSLRAERAYVGWIRRFTLHHKVRHPDETRRAEAVELLSDLPDVAPKRKQITVREGKGDRDRATVLPASLAEPLRQQVAHAHQQYEEDRRPGRAGAWLSHALARGHLGAHSPIDRICPPDTLVQRPAPKFASPAATNSHPTPRPQTPFRPPKKGSTTRYYADTLRVQCAVE